MAVVVAVVVNLLYHFFSGTGTFMPHRQEKLEHGRIWTKTANDRVIILFDNYLFFRFLLTRLSH
jgi:hypothetical protein